MNRRAPSSQAGPGRGVEDAAVQVERREEGAGGGEGPGESFLCKPGAVELS